MLFCLRERHGMSGLYWSCELSGLPGTRARKTTTLRDKEPEKIDNAFRDKTGTQINKPLVYFIP